MRSQASGKTVGAALPTCPRCVSHPPVSFNGCMACGEVFGSNWEDLPMHPESWSWQFAEVQKQVRAGQTLQTPLIRSALYYEQSVLDL